MLWNRSIVGRRGSIMPLLVLCLVSLAGFTSLAIDLGTIMVARNQCQNAADSAAMAGARLLNGDPASNNNYNNAVQGALAAAATNQVLSQPVASSQVTVEVGSYGYDSAQQKFIPSIPRTSNENYSLVRATVTYTGPTSFARVLGIGTFTVSATATAAHPPRDIAIVLDLTGSMKFGSLLGYPWYGNRYGSNNPESVFPLFGHYSDQSAAGLYDASTSYDGSGNVFPPCNWSESNTANQYAPPIVQDFFQSVSPSTVPAFTAAPSSFTSVPGGDNYPRNNKEAGSGWATNAQDYLGSTNKDAAFETSGYSAYRGSGFQGYTQGPSYWGKTFFMWPPDPRSNYDWRQLFFLNAASGTPVTSNGTLYDSSGNWKTPSNSGYKINYQAILQWLGQSPRIFPTQIIAGRILYYSAMPNAADPALNNRFWSQFPLTDRNERFWKEYIDYVLGLQQTDNNSWQVITAQTGYGDDYNWGTVRINTGFSTASDSQHRYMDYTDNPQRPRLHFWFGPMTFADFVSNYNLDDGVNFCWMAGTAHEVPLYSCKIGMQAALQDIRNNHPNDWISLIMFATPKTSVNDTWGRFNRVRTPLGQNYARMTDSLWFPLSTIDQPGTTLSPYDTEAMLEVPHARGGTCYAYGLMLAFNQLSSNVSSRTFDPAPAPAGSAGGLGRKGAQKVVIFETDGEPNTTASASFVNSGAYNSYYQVRYNSSNPAASEYPVGVWGQGDNSPSVTSQIYNVVSQIAASDTASSPGYSSSNKPALVHCIGFGPVFDPSNSLRGNALTTLQQMQYLGNTQSSPSTPLPAYKVVSGTPDQIVDSLRTAIQKIIDDGVQVKLLN